MLSPLSREESLMRRLRVPVLLAGLFVLAGGLTHARADGEWATIKGQVKLTKAPDAKPVNVTADKAFCEKDGPVVSEDIIVGKTGGVKNVVVWLRPDNPNRKAEFPKDKIKPELAKAAPTKRLIDQPCCQFIPRVLAAKTGDTLEIKNSASVNHNINYSSDVESFNVNVPPGKTHAAAQPLAAQGSPILFKCDVHPWMQGRLRVFDHPYFAVTDENGNFEIKDAPAGEWRIVYWHENGFHKGREGILGEKITVKGPTLELAPIELQLPN
jgi:plastocyanin